MDTSVRCRCSCRGSIRVCDVRGALTYFLLDRRLDQGCNPNPPAASSRATTANFVEAEQRWGRDAAAISHHYDLGNDFYRLILGVDDVLVRLLCTQPDDGLTRRTELLRSLALSPEQPRRQRFAGLQHKYRSI
jgi:cyclopropane-fatty-acyl-phospholipid synthase